VMNRLNVSITGMERSSGVSYAPSLTEVSVTLMIVGIGFTLFTLAAKYLPVFQHATEEPELGEPSPEPAWQEPEPARRPLVGSLALVGGLAAILFVSAIGLTGEGVRRTPLASKPAEPKEVEVQKTRALESFRMPADVAFPQSPDSPAPVTFSHAVHVDSGSPECASCHRDGFPLVRTASARTPLKPGAAHKLCAQCHDGTSAFSVENDCEKCHRESPAK
jgi:c(7)-type cytochrome triheme protein